MGPQFLSRLLASPSSSSSSYKPLALAVLRTLAHDPGTLPRLRLPQMLLPLVATLLEESPSSPSDDDDDDAVSSQQEDCLFLLHAFAAHDPGATPLLGRVGAGRGVCRCLVRELGRTRQEEKEEKEGKEEEEEEGVSPLAWRALAALDALVAAEGRALALSAAGKKPKKQQSPSSLLLLDGACLGMLAAALAAERRPTVRFALLPLLATTLAQRRGGVAASAMLAAASKDDEKGTGGGRVPASFGASLRAVLLPWLHGSVKEAQRDGALALLVHALGLLGQTWAVEEEGEEDGKGDGKTGTTGMGRGGAAGLFVGSLAAEARMLGDELQGLVAATHDAELSGDANLQRRLGRAARMLPLCLDGMDSVLRFLCGAGDGGEWVVWGVCL